MCLPYLEMVNYLSDNKLSFGLKNVNCVEFQKDLLSFLAFWID